MSTEKNREGYREGECRYCGQQVKAKDGHWQMLTGYRRLYCAQSPSTWHEVKP